MLSGGRARPMTFLPVAVMASEPAAAITVRTMGVHERHATTIATTTATTRIGMPTPPPMLVNAVTAESSPGLRHDAARRRAGWSRPATPSLSTTAS